MPMGKGDREAHVSTPDEDGPLVAEAFARRSSRASRASASTYPAAWQSQPRPMALRPRFATGLPLTEDPLASGPLCVLVPGGGQGQQAQPKACSAISRYLRSRS